MEEFDGLKDGFPDGCRYKTVCPLFFLIMGGERLCDLGLQMSVCDNIYIRLITAVSGAER